jgi:hypothetical protein
VLLALVVAGGALAGAEAARAAGLSKVVVLVAAGAAATLLAGAIAWIRPTLLLGRHGTWALQQASSMVARRGRVRGGDRPRSPGAEALARAGDAGPE